MLNIMAYSVVFSYANNDLREIIDRNINLLKDKYDFEEIESTNEKLSFKKGLPIVSAHVTDNKIYVSFISTEENPYYNSIMEFLNVVNSIDTIINSNEVTRFNLLGSLKIKESEINDFFFKFDASNLGKILSNEISFEVEKDNNHLLYNFRYSGGKIIMFSIGLENPFKFNDFEDLKNKLINYKEILNDNLKSYLKNQMTSEERRSSNSD